MSNHFNKAKRAAEATRATLVETFPKSFAAKGVDKRPLALGTYRDIMLALPEIGPRRLAAALADYTGGPTYLRHVVEGAPRIGLDGEPKGVVTALQAAHAASRLAAFEAWAASQKTKTEPEAKAA